MRLRLRRSEEAWDVQMWLCAAAGAAWLLQFIEDLQQSREFHKVCELKLPDEAATIPEVLLLLSCSYHLIVTLPACSCQYNQPAQRHYIL